jgi:hypothetical protein
MAAESVPTIRELKNSSGQIIAIEAGPLPAKAVLRLTRQADANEAFSRGLRVSVDDAAVSQTAIAGAYSMRGDALRFTPQFAFRPGQAYRAVLHLSEFAPTSAAAASDVMYRFGMRRPEASPPAEVTAIFPSAASIPENQLRFYVHFSAPMSRGAVYDHVRLLDSRHRALDLPFLELGEELWDPQQQRLTLLIDPGRVKRGVLPRKDLGTVFRAGEQFTLVVQPTWLDAQSRPLRKEFTKTYRVGPPVEEAIDPAQWQTKVPPGGSRDPLTIDFPRPLDRALLERMIAVRSAAGAPVEGQVVVSRDERRWELRPANAWSAGKFEVVVDRALEDLAGNRIGRPFEVDQAGPITQQIQADFVRLNFEIPSAR